MGVHSIHRTATDNQCLRHTRRTRVMAKYPGIDWAHSQWCVESVRLRRPIYPAPSSRRSLPRWRPTRRSVPDRLTSSTELHDSLYYRREWRIGSQHWDLEAYPQVSPSAPRWNLVSTHALMHGNVKSPPKLGGVPRANAVSSAAGGSPETTRIAWRWRIAQCSALLT